MNMIWCKGRKGLQGSFRETIAGCSSRGEGEPWNGGKVYDISRILKDEREAGRAEGRVELVKKKLAKGDSLEKIADDLMEDINVIEEIVKEL